MFSTSKYATRRLVAHPLVLVRSMATQRPGYEAFGSFHTPSTAALFAGEMPRDLPDPNTFLPDLPSAGRLQLDVSASSSSHNRALFTIDFAQWTYLNHGAFGGPTKYASAVAAAWRTFSDSQPLRFNDRLLFPYVVQSIQALAWMLRVADAQELVLLPNATSGLHSVLDGVLRRTLEDGQVNDHDVVVFCFSTRYGAVRKMLQSFQDHDQASGSISNEKKKKKKKLLVHEEPLTLEESYNDDVVLRKLTQWLETTSTTTANKCALVIVDHITSNTGVVLPVEKIVAACHGRQIPVLVDGAHGLLNLPLDLDALGADYYVGNCHKWFASPKGAAFLHVNTRKKNQQLQVNGQTSTQIQIQPRVVSHGFYDGFQSAFMWTGLQDYAPWLSLPMCLAFWQQQDIGKCRAYMHTLAQQATELLYETWQMETELARARKFPAHKRHAMRLVRLPSRRIFSVDCNNSTTTATNSSADAKHIQDTLHFTHGIEVPIKCVDGKLYVRLSAHVYNHISDYEKLAQVIWKA